MAPAGDTLSRATMILPVFVSARVILPPSSACAGYGLSSGASLAYKRVQWGRDGQARGALALMCSGLRACAGYTTYSCGNICGWLVLSAG